MITTVRRRGVVVPLVIFILVGTIMFHYMPMRTSEELVEFKPSIVKVEDIRNDVPLLQRALTLPSKYKKAILEVCK
jgi:hypothetical protein